MSTIYIINDLSQSQAWLHAWLISNRAALAGSGMELAPFPPWALTSIDHHSALFDLACKKYPRFGHFFLESLKLLREHNQQARSGGVSKLH